jgi:hypothetical protein
MKSDLPHLQAATDRLRDLLHQIIRESPKVKAELKSLRAEGHDVLMHVEVSVAFRERAEEEHARAAASGD